MRKSVDLADPRKMYHSCMPDEYDSPWKDMLDRYFEDFLGFFFTMAHTQIDWSRGWESLDSELQKIVRDSVTGKRLADKHMRVWRKDGIEQWVMIHTEVQASPDADFAKRMFVYHYRLFDRYEGPIVSLAVLGDERADWRPREFRSALWGCETVLRFPIVKLIDYNACWDLLESSNNPFAIVVMAHLQAQRSRNAFSKQVSIGQTPL